MPADVEAVPCRTAEADAAAFAMFGSPQWIQRIYRDSRVLHPPQHSQSRITLQRLRITSPTKSVNRMPRRKDWLSVRKEDSMGARRSSVMIRGGTTEEKERQHDD
jgi:hypothetical protein